VNIFHMNEDGPDPAAWQGTMLRFFTYTFAARLSAELDQPRARLPAISPSPPKERGQHRLGS